MRMRGTDFRPVVCASGARGFFGEGYRHHHVCKLLGLTFKKCGLTAKTTTLESRAGHMPLKKDGITPKELKPPCIIVKPLKGVVLNSVGLSGPGAPFLFRTGRWQKQKEPFFISFMSVQKTRDERLQETKGFIRLLLRYLREFSAPVGLEINFSCPNAHVDPLSLINEVGETLDIANEPDIPLQCKFNATAPPKSVAEACKHHACDAITMSNTIPWGMLPERIDWKGLFGSTQSPLPYPGGGGLSGWPLLPIVCEWIRNVRDCSYTKKIWACGGIDSRKAVKRVYDAGADGIQPGTVAILGPWRMPEIISAGYEYFGLAS